MTGNDFNSEFFSNEKQFRVGKFTITVIPSIYKESSSQWSDTIVTSCKSICDKNVYRYEIHPGSDRVKIILSSDQCYIAIVCESQWYEDLYIFDVPHLKKIASFEGINYVDGASEGFFHGNVFYTMPTFSFEGGCGGLRRVCLETGKIETLFPPSFFDGLNIWLTPKPEKNEKQPKILLPCPFGWLGYSFNKVNSTVTISYLLGRFEINLIKYKGGIPEYTFHPNPIQSEYVDVDGKIWLIDSGKQNTKWWQEKLFDRSLELLRIGSGRADATFRDGQEDAIRHIVEGKGRLLVVQKTGWGKSFVYFIATKLLREAGAGPALLISPLLALMRNQIAAAERMGVRAATINSDNMDDWTAVEGKLATGEIDILLISPERLANERFRTQVLAGIAAQISMLVIDEAHCISDWGHDFRPHYRLLERIVKTLPPNLRLLATTATANNRVMEDLAAVLGPKLEVSRGDLNRTSLSLQTIRLPSQAERLAWLAQQLALLQGHGIIYTLTVRDANQVADWLKTRGFNVEAYTGETGDRREALEQALLNNEVKALVATTALGMGYDKPDLAFVIHYQMPGSVVAYYQQVGRAGRALDSAYGVLLSGEEESDITDWFIRSAFPTRKEVADVLGELEEEENGLSVPELLSRVNLSKGRVDKTIALLSLEAPAPIAKQGTKWQLTAATLSDEFWARAERLTALRRDEHQQMQEYVSLPFGDHMGFLIDALDGDSSGVTKPALPPLPTGVNEAVVRDAIAFLQRTSLPIEPRKKWPIGGMPQYGIASNTTINFQAQPGKALCVWGDAGWGGLVRQGKYHDKKFSDELVTACVQMVREWNPQPKPTWVTCVPSLRHPDLVPNFAKRLAAALGLPFHMVIAKTDDRPEQKTMANSTQQARNIDGSLELNGQPVPRGPVILVDDMVDSRWTLTVSAWLLRKGGSGDVYPMALSQTGHDE